MRIAVIGGTGFLGKALARFRSSVDELILAGSRDIDVRKHESVNSFIQRHRTDWVILAAAIADVDWAEREPELADAVNHRGAMYVAEACKRAGTHLMFISTDYVFGGDDSRNTLYECDEAPSPVNAYGRTKAAGEEAVRSIFPKACIARVSWLFGAEGRSLPNTVLDSIESGKRTVSAIVDQHGVPNFARETARCIVELAKASATGTVHITNQGVTSWYEFCRELLRVAGHEEIRVEPISMAQTSRVAKRPNYSALSDKSLRAYGILMPHWRESLPVYLSDRAEVNRLNRSA